MLFYLVIYFISNSLLCKHGLKGILYIHDRHSSLLIDAVSATFFIKENRRNVSERQLQVHKVKLFLSQHIHNSISAPHPTLQLWRECDFKHLYSLLHKVLTYIEYRAVSGVFRTTIDPPPPTPSPPSECVLLPHQRRGVHTGRAGWGGGGSNFGRRQTLDWPLTVWSLYAHNPYYSCEESMIIKHLYCLLHRYNDERCRNPRREPPCRIYDWALCVGYCSLTHALLSVLMRTVSRGRFAA
jgi:hypothetical protein